MAGERYGMCELAFSGNVSLHRSLCAGRGGEGLFCCLFVTESARAACQKNFSSLFFFFFFAHYIHVLLQRISCREEFPEEPCSHYTFSFLQHLIGKVNPKRCRVERRGSIERRQKELRIGLPGTSTGAPVP
jgi:hypothetical protein